MFRRRIATSGLYDEKTFYGAFIRDVDRAQTRVIIESPFITLRRYRSLELALEAAVCRGVLVAVNTRDPNSHNLVMREQALACVDAMQEFGAGVLYTSSLHRKIAIVDDILWEGSLNILSQNDSCEIMRRTVSANAVKQMIRFTGLSRWYNQGKL
jgi:phosphatidylserine/phosphatidylglycerophosphate/cardiolipin synthase-like enzyme